MQERGNMSQIDKLINKIENYRSSDQISFSELEKYLIYFGFFIKLLFCKWVVSDKLLQAML